MIQLFDAHMHLQEPELAGLRDEIAAEWSRLGLAKAVVNGTSEVDWPAVKTLGIEDSRVLPSYGLHPWYVDSRSVDWYENLESRLRAERSVVGEIGIDRGLPRRDDAIQEEVFLRQLDLGYRLNRAVTIHCVKAWGRLEALLKTHTGRLPGPGFLLHAYGGSAEMVPGFADLGAYFSFSSFATHERTAKRRKALTAIPEDRLLIETDAPALLPPSDRINRVAVDPESGRPINHPANIEGAYRFVAEFLGVRVESLAKQVEANFLRLFGHDFD
jgi:TatD DNase family protein